jgi:hypothetical protein
MILTSRNGDLVRADLLVAASASTASPYPSHMPYAGHSWGSSASPLHRKGAALMGTEVDGVGGDDDVREGGQKVDQGPNDSTLFPTVKMTARKLGSYHAGRITGVVMLQREVGSPELSPVI